MLLAGRSEYWGFPLVDLGALCACGFPLTELGLLEGCALPLVAYGALLLGLVPIELGLSLFICVSTCLFVGLSLPLLVKDGSAWCIRWSTVGSPSIHVPCSCGFC